MKRVRCIFFVTLCALFFHSDVIAQEPKGLGSKTDIASELNLIKSELKLLRSELKYEQDTIDLKGKMTNAELSVKEAGNHIIYIEKAIAFYTKCLTIFMSVATFLLVTGPIAIFIYISNKTKKFNQNMDAADKRSRTIEEELRNNAKQYIDEQSSIKIKELTDQQAEELKKRTDELSLMHESMSWALARFYTTLAVHMFDKKERIEKVIEFQQNGISLFVRQFGDDLNVLTEDRRRSLLTYWQNLSYFYAERNDDKKADFAINKVSLALKYAVGEEGLELENYRRIEWIDSYLHVLMRYDLPTKRQEWKNNYGLWAEDLKKAGKNIDNYNKYLEKITA
jgi:ABC-type multidrug transport system fused ATPase/permease subunit